MTFSPSINFILSVLRLMIYDISSTNFAFVILDGITYLHLPNGPLKPFVDLFRAIWGFKTANKSSIGIEILKEGYLS